MKELNELVELAEKADAVANLMDGVNPHNILAIAEAFRALEQRAEAAEREAANAKYEWGEAQSNYDASKKSNVALREKLAELEKQEPVAYVHPAYLQTGALGFDASISRLAPAQIPLFTRPAQPVKLSGNDFDSALALLNDVLDDCGDSERGLLLALSHMGYEVQE